MNNPRIVCNFSCGAASAVATKLILSEYPPERVIIINAFLKREHPDNQRFLKDCEAWFEHPIIQVREEKYNADPQEVWMRKKFMVGRNSAPCSHELKRKPLDALVEPNDIRVLGYTAEEEDRFDGFLSRNSGMKVIAPLIERGLKKEDCLAMIERAAIALPALYLMGYNNNNCIGCPKGGKGYWNKIRRDFPEEFERVAAIQDILGVGSYFFYDAKTKTRRSLRELREDEGRHDEPEISCGFFCALAEDEINHADRTPTIREALNSIEDGGANG